MFFGHLQEMLLKNYFYVQRTNKSHLSLESQEDEKIGIKIKYLTPMGCFQTAGTTHLKIGPGYWEESNRKSWNNVVWVLMCG